MSLLGTIGSLAAGYFTGGLSGGIMGLAEGAMSGMAAGALTGASIAAIEGEDVGMGAISGGLGGYGGGGLGAANATVAGNALASSGGKAVMNQGLMSPYTGKTLAGNALTPQSAGMFANPAAVSPAKGLGFPGIKGLQEGSFGPDMGVKPQFHRMDMSGPLSPQPGQQHLYNQTPVANPTTGFASETPGIPDAKSGGYKLSPNEIPAAKTPTGTDYFTDVMEEYGGGLTSADGTPNPNAFYKGLTKTGMAGFPIIAEALPKPDYPEYGDNPMNRYDPNRSLDLSMDTGIDAALAKDSGLRLLAQGGYLDGGNVGDGMSDDIPARIDGGQEAALSQGEFVVPADVVSHLGNGSSDAGSKRLYDMMRKIRQARTGTEKQGKEINPERYMPA